MEEHGGLWRQQDNVRRREGLEQAVQHSHSDTIQLPAARTPISPCNVNQTLVLGVMARRVASTMGLSTTST